ncbi:MAG: hypothetical protein U5K79_22900 [Cyclobacteriaceae bacterium]|nr:hypothetical protein [Cyclobacteriaceae bacterium]
MDIQAEKLNLIEWIAGLEDSQIIRQVISLQYSTSPIGRLTLSEREKNAIEKGLKSINEGKVHSHEKVVDATKKKYPRLFK